VLSKEAYRLADSTTVEPLINQWAVWSDLIAPAPYSMHLEHYQIKMVTSYLENPETHLKACRNPKLIGGPFVDIPAERADEVRGLLDSMQAQHANRELARAITEVYESLTREAKGQSLEAFYARLPESLRGYTELVYDYYNHPILRLMEGLLYASHYYNKNAQSLRISATAHDHSRRFFLSTPRLLDEGEIDWRTPFESPEIDELFGLEFSPKPLDYIREVMGLSVEEEKKLSLLLSSEPAVPPEPWRGKRPRIRYLGHACVLLEWNGVSILTDPWIGVMPINGGVERLTYRDLPEKIDFALITHAHHDHFVPETLLRLRHRIERLVVPKTNCLFYTDPSLKLLARQIGFKNVVEMDSLESLELPDGEIVAAPFLGEHADLAHGKSAYVIRAGKERILFAADSNCLDTHLYKHLRRYLGDIETVFLGMECVGAPLSWLYGALLPSRIRHSHDNERRTKGSDSEAALAMLEAVGAKRVYIYAMGNEPWLQYGMGLGLSEDSIQIREANKVIRKARNQGFIAAQRPFGKFDVYLGNDAGPPPQSRLAVPARASE
jgi:L-ascorbate metabolism protein UlaG (beta-lactamase superfamily)